MALENYVKFLRGTPTSYEALTSKDKNTLYFISEKGSEYGTLYLGNKVIAGGEVPEKITLDSLKDVAINKGLEDGSLLVYDIDTNSWINLPMEEALQKITNVMTGATADEDGSIGLVPAPKAGQQEYFLKGDGTWAKPDGKKADVFEAFLNTGESHEEAIARVVDAERLSAGDIAIIKQLIAEDKYQYTSYIYDNEWRALDENYDARNIYFNEDFTITSSGETGNGSIIIPAAGKNLKELFNAIFVKESSNTESIKTLIEVVDELTNKIGNPDEPSGLYEEVSKKADAENVYTKKETDELISQVNHLQRKILENYAELETYVANNNDAEKYIFMIPIEAVIVSQNWYDEYMYIEGKIEKIGTLSADLSNYVSKEEIKNYITKEEFEESQLVSSDGDNSVSINNDKTMTVKTINVNTLSQDEGSWIVLFGGTSSL